MKKLILFALCALAAVATWGRGAVPDFNYPKQVATQAEDDLRRALSAGDGQAVVSAAVRASIAQSLLSRDKSAEIIDRLERTAATERDPATRAMLLYFEAAVMHSYRQAFIDDGRRGEGVYVEDPDPAATARDRYAAWTADQCRARVDELIGRALADSAALCAVPVTRFADVLTYNNLGASYLPTVYQFIAYRCMSLAGYSLKKELWQRLLGSTTGDATAHTWARLKYIDEHLYNDERRKARLELLAERPDDEVSGMVLSELSDDADYAALRAYVKRYPKSVYADDVRDNISSIEASSVNLLASRAQRHSGDSIPVYLHLRNVGALSIDVYRLTDEQCAATRGDLEVEAMTRVASHALIAPGTVPFDTTLNVALPPLPYGCYALVPRYRAGDGSEAMLKRVPRSESVAVFDVATHSVATADARADRIVAVDVASGAPAAGVTVGDDRWSGVTGSDGTVAVPDHRGYTTMKFTARRGDDHYGPQDLFRRMDTRDTHFNECELYTDLGIYRPGETLRYAGVAYTRSVTQRRPLAEVPVTVSFIDANGKQIDSHELTTDGFGRVEGEFEVPAGRLLGTYVVRMQPNVSGRTSEATHTVQVSEYKTPTFYVDMPQTDLAYEPGQPVTVTGRVVTYTDLPVAGAEVRLSLTQRTWDWLWWWRPMPARSYDNAVADTLVRTDAYGRFAVEFAPDRFDENRSRRYCAWVYTTHVHATNAAGESQEAYATFHIGSKRQIELGANLRDINNTAPVRLPVTVNCTDSTMMPTHLNWALRLDNAKRDTVATGTLALANPVIDFTAVPSGAYTLLLAIPGGDNTYERKSCDITLYRTTDSQAPVKNTPLWVPSDGYRIDDNNVAHITVGASVDVAHIYYVATGRERVLEQGWATVRRGFDELTFAVPGEADERLTVHLTSVYDTRFYTEQVTMASPVNRRTLTVRATAFRDGLTPGTPERWQLQLIDKDDKPQRGAMMLEMIDRALNDLADNTWQLSPQYVGFTPAEFRSMALGKGFSSRTSWRAKLHLSSAASEQLPELDTYGKSLWEGLAIRYHYALYETTAMGAARPMMKVRGAASIYGNAGDGDDYAIEESADDGVDAEPEVDRDRLDRVATRLADVKTALWKPMLTSDEQGNITIEFTAPDFNTTWLVQALAYTDEMTTTRFERSVLTRKPIMVRPSLPRFVRHGDSVTLAATLQNATDSTQQCEAMIELFDPRTGDVYTSQTYRRTLAPQATQPLTIDWAVPDTLALVAFRVRAANANFGDGEQALLPVFTAVAPIVETTPFFIDADRSTTTVTLPHVTEQARYTLEYCDNPVWTAVAALPAVADAGCVATGLAHSLFAVDMARGVIHSQPIIGEALRYWSENCPDSTLAGALAAGGDVKIGTLLASPWLGDSERQALQMRRLLTYADSTAARAEHDRLVEALAALQQPDGGFTWYNYAGCTSSLWATGHVLEVLGQVRLAGYGMADPRLEQMCARALDYYDRAMVEQSKKKENKGRIFASYARVRSLFANVPPGRDAAKLLKRTLKDMGKKWGKLNLSQGDKALYALTLEYNGMHKQALPIVQSIREFALTDDRHGMYWDNYSTGRWFTPSQVAVTSKVLKALHEVDRKQDELDQVRKWLLLSKQTTDWGGSSLAADATYALLTTGSEWLTRGQAPVVTLDGERVPLDSFDAYTGYCRRTIDAHSGSRLTIERGGGTPAWGAVYCQYAQQMHQVQPSGTDDLKISKDFLVLTPGDVPQQGAIAVGDKVQVRLTITCGRDIDYLTLTDERAACFEPADHTSGYRYTDGVGHYRETRDAATNIFIRSLSKGTHVITYDVFATAPGRFSSGVATIQCQQSPDQTAHSEGNIIHIAPAGD